VKSLSFRNLIIALIFIPVACLAGDTNWDNSSKEISKYQKNIAQNPNDCFSLSQLGSIRQYRREFYQAIELYDRAYSICGNLLDLFQIAFTYYIVGDHDKGRKLAKQAINLASEKGDKELESMFLKEFEYLESQIQ
jgi:tetratricopeptide (TPR) repeat protein